MRRLLWLQMQRALQLTQHTTKTNRIRSAAHRALSMTLTRKSSTSKSLSTQSYRKRSLWSKTLFISVACSCVPNSCERDHVYLRSADRRSSAAKSSRAVCNSLSTAAPGVCVISAQATEQYFCIMLLAVFLTTRIGQRSRRYVPMIFRGCRSLTMCMAQLQ